MKTKDFKPKCPECSTELRILGVNNPFKYGKCEFCGKIFDLSGKEIVKSE